MVLLNCAVREGSWRLLVLVGVGVWQFRVRVPETILCPTTLAHEKHFAGFLQIV